MLWFRSVQLEAYQESVGRIVRNNVCMSIYFYICFLQPIYTVRVYRWCVLGSLEWYCFQVDHREHIELLSGYRKWLWYCKPSTDRTHGCKFQWPSRNSHNIEGSKQPISYQPGSGSVARLTTISRLIRELR